MISKSRKKAELSIEMMVLIALALIFLIIVAFVMTGKIKIFSKGLGDCETKSGKCMDKEESCYGTVTGFDCADKKICCMNTCEGATKHDCTTGTSCNSGQEQLYTVACKEPNTVCCK